MAPERENDPFWVFGYGSLMWDPGFPHLRRTPARLEGYRRALCVVSRRHRGTAGRPGLVMGLAPAPGAACIGIAFAVDRDWEEHVRAYLWEREVPGYIYREATVAVTPAAAQRVVDAGAAVEAVEALTFLPDPNSPDFLPDLPDEEIVARIAAAHGGRGPNLDYLRNTVAHLDTLGIDEPALRTVLARAEAAVGDEGAP